jgi:plasmid stability protein
MTVSLTLTLDDEVVARLREEASRSGRSIDATVNDLLKGASSELEAISPPPFRVEARPLGQRPGVDIECVSRLLDQLDLAAER